MKFDLQKIRVFALKSTLSMGNTQEKGAAVESIRRESPIVQWCKATHKYLSSRNVGNDVTTAATIESFKVHLQVPGCHYADRFTSRLQTLLSDINYVTEQEFIDIGEEVSSLIPGSLAFTEYYTKILSTGESELRKTDAFEILESAFCVACAFNRVDYQNDNLTQRFQPVIDSMFSREETISQSALSSWIQRHAALLFASTHAWTLERLKTPGPYKRGQSQGVSLLDQMNAHKSLLSLEMLFLLSSTLPLVYCSTQHGQGGHISALFHWLSLYDSNKHGLSMNRFDHHVIAYKGPTVCLVSFEEHVYLVATEEEWRGVQLYLSSARDSIERWGGRNCVMIELAPKYRIIQGEASLCFLNLTSRSVPKGFQFGKDSRSVMLEIDEDMSNVQYYGTSIKLERFEVWGCGSQTVRDVQLEQKQWEQNQVEKHKNRKLKLEDWKDSPDRMLLELGGVKVTHSEEHPNE